MFREFLCNTSWKATVRSETCLQMTNGLRGYAWSTVHFLYHFGRFRLNHQLSSIILPHERANGNPNFLDFMNIIGFWLKKTVPAGLSRAHFLCASNQVTDESRPMATRGYWGQHPPNVFFAPPNFVASIKICFEHNKSRTLYPLKTYFAPKKLNTWLRVCRRPSLSMELIETKERQTAILTSTS